MYECATCPSTFPGWAERNAHCNEAGHDAPAFECDRCPWWFANEDDRIFHMANFNHFEHMCPHCFNTFQTEECLREHEVVEHWWCSACETEFTSLDAVRLHLHFHERLFLCECPFCDMQSSIIGLLMHLEDECAFAPDLTYHDIYRVVREQDTSGLISHLEENYSVDQLWNGARYLCPKCGGSFRLLSGLYQHLTSPRHNLCAV